MIPIITWEIKQRRAFILGWTFGVLAIVIVILMIYPSIHHQASQLNETLNKLPAAIRDLKTGGSKVDVTSPLGFLNSQLYYATLPLLYIIMAINLGSNLLARDEQNHALELVLARPIKRTKILAAKALSGVCILLFVATLATLATLALSKVVDLQVSVHNLLLVNIFCAIFSCSFGAIAFTLTALSNRTRQISVALPIVISLGGYLLASLSGLSSYLEVPAKLLPYHYYYPAGILQGNIANGLIIYLVGIFVLCTLASKIGFQSRDIY